MINSTTIQRYISYLYKRKTGNEIPEDVLDSWNNLEDKEVDLHLIELYNSWRIHINDARMMEDEFIKTTSKSKPVIPSIQPYETPVTGNSTVNAAETAAKDKHTYSVYPEAKKPLARPWYLWAGLAVVFVALLSIVSAKYIFSTSPDDDATEEYTAPQQTDNATSEPDPIPVSVQPSVEQNNSANQVQTTNGRQHGIAGTVSVSTKGFFGTKNAQRIERQLQKEAKKLYPNNAGITNVRYEGNNAFADVMY